MSGVIAALLLAVAASAVTPAGVLAASGRYLDPIFAGVRVDSDMTYGRVVHPDGSVEPLKLDLYRPVGDTARNRPVVIYVHGGGSEIDKAFERNAMVGRMFAKRGFVGAVIAYRDGTSGMAQDAAWDLRAAVRWFKKNAGTLRVSPNRIIVMGVPGVGDAAVIVAPGVLFVRTGTTVIGIQPLTEFDSPQELSAALTPIGQAIVSRL